MNIGVIGSGFIVDVFVKGMKQYRHVNLYAIWGRHEEKIRSFDCFKKYYLDIDEFLSDPEIDVVYVALPNSLHYEYAYKALKANKHVMLEKPFTQNYRQAKVLVDYAKKHRLLLFETIMTKYAVAYKKLQKDISKLGEIKMIEINFTQYSRKYAKFKNNIIMPAFDYRLAGGALMDLGLYGLHFIVDIFGTPKSVNYFANIEKKIDTSGTVILDYGSYKAALICAKDCGCDSYCVIQGDEGYIKVSTTPARCSNYTLVLNNGKKKEFSTGDDSEFTSWKTMYDEFMKLYKNKDYERCYKHLEDTLRVQKVLDKARASAGLIF